MACGRTCGTQFQARFRIPHILEFYGATEGNVNIFNFEGKPGAVGRVPWFVAHRFPIAVVRFDVERQQPVRNAEGFCERCAPNEPGEVIGKIVNDPTRPGNRFEGYADNAENESKILRDVFEKGDAWFRTGDLMRQRRRTAISISSTASATPSAGRARTSRPPRWPRRSIVFPGVQRRQRLWRHRASATTAAPAWRRSSATAHSISPALHAHLARHLPDYARPLFLRIQSEIDVTSDLQAEKIDLVSEGFNPAATSDAIYFNDPQARRLRAARRRRCTAGIERGRSPAVIASRPKPCSRSGARPAPKVVQEGRRVRRRDPPALS